MLKLLNKGLLILAFLGVLLFVSSFATKAYAASTNTESKALVTYNACLNVERQYNQASQALKQLEDQYARVEAQNAADVVMGKTPDLAKARSLQNSINKGYQTALQRYTQGEQQCSSFTKAEVAPANPWGR